MLSLLLAGLLLRPAPPYSAVVVDARTNKPLAGVSVRVTGHKHATTTDAHGVFQVAGTAPGLELSHYCYAPLHTTVPAAAGSRDTLRLLPTSYVLEPVTLHPPRIVSFSSVPCPRGQRLLPGQSVALLLERRTEAAPRTLCIVHEVRFAVQPDVKQGRLRVRLVNTQAPGAGTQDLLPAPVLFSAEQLRAAPGGELALDLRPYDLLLPLEWLCVVVDCLPTDEADRDAVLTTDAQGRPAVQLAASAEALGHQVAAADFPLLAGKRGHSKWATRARIFYTPETDFSRVTP